MGALCGLCILLSRDPPAASPPPYSHPFDRLELNQGGDQFALRRGQVSPAPDESLGISLSVVHPFVLRLGGSMGETKAEPTPDPISTEVQIELHSPSRAGWGRASSNPPVAAVPSTDRVEMNLGEISRFVRGCDHDLKSSGPILAWCRDEEFPAGQGLPGAAGPLDGDTSVSILECPATGQFGEIDSRGVFDQATFSVPAPSS